MQGRGALLALQEVFSLCPDSLVWPVKLVVVLDMLKKKKNDNTAAICDRKGFMSSYANVCLIML